MPRPPVKAPGLHSLTNIPRVKGQNDPDVPKWAATYLILPNNPNLCGKCAILMEFYCVGPILVPIRHIWRILGTHLGPQFHGLEAGQNLRIAKRSAREPLKNIGKGAKKSEKALKSAFGPKSQKSAKKVITR